MPFAVTFDLESFRRDALGDEITAYCLGAFERDNRVVHTVTDCVCDSQQCFVRSASESAPVPHRLHGPAETQQRW